MIEVVKVCLKYIGEFCSRGIIWDSEDFRICFVIFFNYFFVEVVCKFFVFEYFV